MGRKPKTEAEQLAFFERFKEAWIRAASRTGEVRRFFDLAGTTICISFAGEALMESLCPALAHLESERNTKPDLVIYAWDTESTGVPGPPPPCPRRDFTDRGDIWGFDSKRIKTAFHYSEFSVNLMDLEQNEGLYWVSNARNFPYWVFSSPFRTLFHWWMQKNGCQLLHAAAVGNENGAVLITGKGGTGKSSTAIRCLEDGMLYLGDDYVVVSVDPAPKVYSLYSTAKLSPDDLERFPSLSGIRRATYKRQPEKETLFLWPERSGQIRRDLPLLVVLTPEIRSQEQPAIAPASFWKVQRSMSFTTMSQLPGADHTTHEYMGALLDRLPFYTLALGRDRNPVPEVVRQCLSEPGTREGEKVKTGETSAHPLITVIVPVYNGEKFIRQAVDNILSQDYPALELIFVDDGSLDNTREIIDSLSVDYRYFRQANQGPAAARNRGIKNASGDYIAFLDVDDYWPQDNLGPLMAELLSEPGLDLVRGYAQLVRGNDSSPTEFLGNPKESFPNYIGAGLYRKAVFSKVGLYDPSLRFGEDSDWFLRAVESGIAMKRLDEVTLFVRRHGENMTEGKDMVELNTLKVFKKILERKRTTRNV